MQYKMGNFAGMAVHPLVDNAIHGNVNGEQAALQLFEMVRGHEQTTSDRSLIAVKLEALTVGHLGTCPTGLCLYNEEYRLLVLNETKSAYRMGGSERMFLIGDMCTKQGIKYRHLKGAASDGGTILLIALPLTKAQREQRGKAIEARVVAEQGDIVDEGTTATVLMDEKGLTMEDIAVPVVRRDIKRKKREEVDITKLENESDE